MPLSRTLSLIAGLGLSILSAAETQPAGAVQVIYAAPTGLDANDGKGAATPKSLNGALAAAAGVATRIILCDGGYGMNWQGLLDEVLIYDRAYDAAGLELLYRATAAPSR